MTILLERGQRGIIVGQTGSGKTVGAIFQLQNTPLYPVVILDTKGEPAFDRIARDEEEIIIHNSADDFVKSWTKDEQPGYVICRPTPREMSDLDGMDQTLEAIYEIARPALIYIDEAYQWHINGRSGPGLIGLLTRGRSKGLTTLISTQRPAWISRFCFSEAQKYYIYKIGDGRDSKTIAEFLPGYDKMKKVEKHHFVYYDSSSGEKPKFFKPVPLPPKRNYSVENQLDEKSQWL